MGAHHSIAVLSYAYANPPLNQLHIARTGPTMIERRQEVPKLTTSVIILPILNKIDTKNSTYFFEK